MRSNGQSVHPHHIRRQRFALGGEESERLAERLTRFVTGAAWVEATPSQET
ncbi:MAG: hypothetical protein ACREM1_03565 [Longimicrobiales bacterium]